MSLFGYNIVRPQKLLGQWTNGRVIVIILFKNSELCVCVLLKTDVPTLDGLITRDLFALHGICRNMGIEPWVKMRPNSRNNVWFESRHDAGTSI